MKLSYYRGFVCSKCGGILKSKYVEYCPKCRARIITEEQNTKALVISLIIAFIFLYGFFYLLFHIRESEFVNNDNLLVFNLLFFSFFAVMLILSVRSHTKLNRRAEEDKSFIGSFKTSTPEIKMIFLEVEKKYKILSALSLLSLIPVFFIFFFLDRLYNISDYPAAIILFLAIWISNIISPFYFSWKGMSKALNKKMDEEHYTI